MSEGVEREMLWMKQTPTGPQWYTMMYAFKRKNDSDNNTKRIKRISQFKIKTMPIRF